MGKFLKGNIYVTVMAEREKRENEAEGIFEIIKDEIFPKLIKDIKPQIQEVQRTPIFFFFNLGMSDKIFKAKEGKETTYL